MLQGDHHRQGVADQMLCGKLLQNLGLGSDKSSFGVVSGYSSSGGWVVQVIVGGFVIVFAGFFRTHLIVKTPS